MSRRLRLGLLLAAGLVQLAVPLGMIVARERTLAEGDRWLFRAAPVDPADPFRGRYLALGFAGTEALVPAGEEVAPGDRVWVQLERDEEGFARLGQVRTERPEAGASLRVVVGWVQGDPERAEARFASLRLPFDRLYLEEGLARRAEAVLVTALRPPPPGEEAPAAPAVWAVVRVRAGQAVLEDVEVEGRSIRELAEGGD